MPICLASSGSSTEIILENKAKLLLKVSLFVIFHWDVFYAYFFPTDPKNHGLNSATNTLPSTGTGSTSDRDRGIVSSLGSQCIY